jgi:hypothetical protein
MGDGRTRQGVENAHDEPFVRRFGSRVPFGAVLGG